MSCRLDWIPGGIRGHIKVIGIGCGGNNVVNRMVKSGTKGVDFIAITRTNRHWLVQCNIKNQIGEKLTHGQCPVPIGHR